MRWVTVLVIGGCATPGALPDGDLTVIAESKGILVTSTGAESYALRFSPGELQMPKSLTYRDTELIGATQNASEESGVGVGLFPAWNAIASELLLGRAQLGAVSSTATIELAGPAVGRVRVAWSIAYTCAGGPHTATGESSFTVFPSGRIVDTERQINPANSILMGVGGACGIYQDSYPESLYFPTTFWTFAGDPSANVDDHDLPLTDPNLGTDHRFSVACARWPGFAVGMRWPNAQSRFKYGDPTYNPFIHDYLPDINTSTVVDASLPTITTSLRLATGLACADLATGIPTLDLALTVADAPVVIADDGIFRDPTPHHGRFTVRAEGTGIPAGWALSLDVGGSDLVRVTRTHDNAGFYLAQKTGDDGGLDANRVILYFRDALDPTDTITIEPM